MVNNKEKVALVLSGGGALGAYEVGVWKALIKLHYKFNIATGTSVGALNALMVVQKDFKKAYKLWSNISFADIYDENFDNKISKKELYHKYAKEIVANGGMDPKALEKLVQRAYDAQKFYNSDIDYGLVTFNLSSFKPEVKTKKEIKPDQIVNYAIASASCFPAFKVKNIDGNKYIDGGYYDNMPINLAIDMGATHIIAIDLKAIGIKRKTKEFAGDIVIITPNNKLLNMLDFDTVKMRQAIKFGYNDTLKKFHKLDGTKFTFKKDHLQKNYLNYQKRYTNYLNKLALAKEYKQIDLIIFKAEEINNNFAYFQEIVESCGEVFNLPEEIIYDIRKYNKKLKKELLKVESLNIKEIVKNIKGIFDKRVIIKTIYEQLENPKYLKQLQIVSDILPKEFLQAIYLKIWG